MRSLELRIPPAALVVGAAVSMRLVAWGLPLLSFPIPGRRILAVTMAVAGAGISLLGVAAFRQAGTTVNPLQPSAARVMVVSGVYQRTRNPMYLGFLLILIGWAVWLANALAFGVVPGFILYMNRFQIAPEEKALAAGFGAEFQLYKSKVRRWL